MRRPTTQTVGYVSALAGCLLTSLAAGWSQYGRQVDNNAYDFLFRQNPAGPWEPRSVILTIDEPTLSQTRGGIRRVRTIIAEGLETLAGARPAAVVSDIILADEGDPAEDARLEAALAGVPNLILPSELLASGWENPLPRFARHAQGIGHVQANPDPMDNVSRQIPLEWVGGMDRRWALSLEAFRLAKGEQHILETPDELRVGGITIPAPRGPRMHRPMLVRYLPARQDGSPVIPRISFLQLRENPELAGRLQGKVVFLGATAQSYSRDRLMTPFSFGRAMPGVEVHASAFETLMRGEFLTAASDTSVLAYAILMTLAAGLTFAYLSGWAAYSTGALLLLAAHVVPYVLFRNGIVFPYAVLLSSAWLSVAASATYQHFIVRRRLRTSEAERYRYQQAIHFVTHEMRTPLTAIQGSSELIGRYNLNDDKRKQLAQMINSESKRLAGMIQTFLNVERLSDGQMELKKELFPLGPLMSTCSERVRPLAERKQIRVVLEEMPAAGITGDRELMEYAVYNLMNNAIKYSPPETEVRVSAVVDDGHLRLSVSDQGMGMDEKDLKNIFRRFYRTKRAEASGEAGTGIGLSIVEKIITSHGGRIEVTSQPGKGSCFTVVLAAAITRAEASGIVR